MLRATTPTNVGPPQQRRGAIFVLAALALVLVFGFTAFTVDIGYIAMTRGQLQNAADSGALGGLIEVGDSFGPGSTKTDAEVAAAASAAAVATVANNRAADRGSVFSDATRDVRLGQYSYDSSAGTWAKQWGVTPYNMVEVTLHRDQGGSTSGDGPLDLFFAPVMGTDQATVMAKSTAVLQPGSGIRAGRDGFASILPITLDLDTWTRFLATTSPTAEFPDDYSYDEDTGVMSTGSDGVLEVNLYPEHYGSDSSNRGTLDIGETNNSAADIARQILEGLNESDMDAIGGELTWPHWFNGDPGLSAGIQDELDAIKGLPRMIPIFDVTDAGHGANLDYHVVKFVGIRIMYVKLSGKPTSKKVFIQPSPFVGDEVIPDENGEITVDSIFAPGRLIRD